MRVNQISMRIQNEDVRIPMNIREARQKVSVGIFLAHAHFHENIVLVAKCLKIGMLVKEVVQNMAPGARLAADDDEDIFV